MLTWVQKRKIELTRNHLAFFGKKSNRFLSVYELDRKPRVRLSLPKEASPYILGYDPIHACYFNSAIGSDPAQARQAQAAIAQQKALYQNAQFGLIAASASIFGF